MTLRCVVKLREAKPPCGEPVEVRCRDLGTVTTDVRESQVVSHDQNDVGAISWLSADGLRTNGLCHKCDNSRYDQLSDSVWQATHGQPAAAGLCYGDELKHAASSHSNRESVALDSLAAASMLWSRKEDQEGPRVATGAAAGNQKLKEPKRFNLIVTPAISTVKW